MFSTFIRFVALVSFAILPSLAFAHPTPATLSFTSPTLSGSFNIKIDPETQTLLAITSVSLNIDGYNFKTKDVGFRHDATNNITFIAGLPNGIDNIVGGGSSDFYLVWTPAPAGGYVSFISYTSGTQVVPGTAVTLTIAKKNK